MAWTRRRFLALAGGGIGVVALGAVGVELVDHGVLPGKSELDRLDGACSLPASTLTFATPGPSVTGSFSSRARGRTVSYSIAYPPGHAPGDILPLVVMLHGLGGDHAHSMSGMTPAQALALAAPSPLRPMAMVTVDGGTTYWNTHPGDDAYGMVVDELIPLCRGRGLGTGAKSIAMMGISMGGYGALLLAERNPQMVGAVAAISPAVWTTYGEANSADPGAFSSPSAFGAADVISHTSQLKGIPVRIASGQSDPFHPGVQALAGALPSGSTVVFSKGCHDGSFFNEQEPPSLAFVSAHIDQPT